MCCHFLTILFGAWVVGHALLLLAAFYFKSATVCPLLLSSSRHHPTPSGFTWRLAAQMVGVCWLDSVTDGLEEPADASAAALHVLINGWRADGVAPALAYHYCSCGFTVEVVAYEARDGDRDALAAVPCARVTWKPGGASQPLSWRFQTDQFLPLAKKRKDQAHAALPGEAPVLVSDDDEVLSCAEARLMAARWWSAVIDEKNNKSSSTSSSLGAQQQRQMALPPAVLGSHPRSFVGGFGDHAWNPSPDGPPPPPCVTVDTITVDWFHYILPTKLALVPASALRLFNSAALAPLRQLVDDARSGEDILLALLTLLPCKQAEAPQQHAAASPSLSPFGPPIHWHWASAAWPAYAWPVAALAAYLPEMAKFVGDRGRDSPLALSTQPRHHSRRCQLAAALLGALKDVVVTIDLHQLSSLGDDGLNAHTSTKSVNAAVHVVPGALARLPTNFTTNFQRYNAWRYWMKQLKRRYFD